MKPIAKLLRFLLPGLLTCGAILAQEEQPPQPPSVEEIQARVEAIGKTEVPEKEGILASYGQALRELERAKELDARAAEFARQVEETPARIEKLNEELALPPARDVPDLPPTIELRELERGLQEAEADRAAAQQRADDLVAGATQRPERLKALTEELARVRSAITEKETSLRTAGVTDEAGRARDALVLAQLEALRAEDRTLAAERRYHEARRELSPLLQDQAQRALTGKVELVQFWQERVTNLRQEEAEAAAREVERQRRETAKRVPALDEIASRNEVLASLRSGEEGIPAQIDLARSARRASRDLFEEVTRRSRATRRKVAVVGASESMGRLLRREREWIVSQLALRPDPEARERALTGAQLLQITLEEEREAVGDIATCHEEIMATLAEVDHSSTGEELSAFVRELLVTQRGLHDTLIQELTRLVDTLLEDIRLDEELLEAAEAYGAYIDERILWVPSTVGGVLPAASDVVGGLSWLVSGSEWSMGIERARGALGRKPGTCLSLALLIFGLLLFRRRFRRGLIQTSDLVRSSRTDRYGHTVRALGYTIALALPFPLLMWAVGWLLGEPADQVEVARCVGSALRTVAFTFLALEFVRQVASLQGLGEAHFRWARSATAVLRGELLWYLPVMLTLSCLVVAFDRQSDPGWNDAVGRIFYVGTLVAYTAILVRLFRPSSGVLAEHYRRTDGLLKRTHKLWFGLSLAAPLALLVLTLIGFYYSALRYNVHVRSTIELAIGLVLLNSLLLRWLFIARRRLAVEQARQRAQAKAQAVEAEGEAPIVESETLLDEETIDIPAVDAQTRKLIRSGIFTATLMGLFFIWAGAFPALRAFNKIQVWPEFHVPDAEDFLSEDVDPVALPVDTSGAAAMTPVPAATTPIPAGATPRPAATTPNPAAEVPTVVTLADLLLALIVFVLTGVAARDGPAVLEISILQRLPVDSGSRHAMSTLFRYGILIIGLTIGFGAIGIGWNKIQWLAAALTFGLAFGLQEIFANFVSGIIILLERPVRVGDVVTVGETEGRVTRLRMRATTILDWDRRELLVPNKEFITGSIINWTLSDPVTRVVVPVGIAYGSDTKKARELLMHVAADNPLVLDEPAPTAIFRGFGASSLDFELRVFMANRNLWPEIIDRLHTQIDDLFRAAGIEIAFPQRDIHIRSADGLRQNEVESAGTD